VFINRATFLPYNTIQKVWFDCARKPVWSMSAFMT